jgi:hypothetical protein
MSDQSDGEEKYASVSESDGMNIDVPEPGQKKPQKPTPEQDRMDVNPKEPIPDEGEKVLAQGPPEAEAF